MNDPTTHDPTLIELYCKILLELQKLNDKMDELIKKK